MRLDELTVRGWKNLRDFTVEFDQASPYTVLVGGNGAGKSNLMEALTLIFRHLDLDQPAPFEYELRYICRGSHLDVKAQAGRRPDVRRRDADSDGPFKRLARRAFQAVDDDDRPLYRPAFVFGYYSGPSDRLAALYQPHRNRYYNWIIRPEERRDRVVHDPNALRRLFFAETMHGQFALIAFFMETQAGDSGPRFLREHLHIDGLDSVLFALKKPGWAQRPDRNDRFWGAEGEVRTFLDRLYDAAMLPGRMNRRMPTGIGTEASVENVYLFLPDEEALQRVYATYGDQYEFFTALESTHLSEMLAEVRTRVRMTPAAGGGRFTYRDLSEGEQQLLLVLGLIKFTARDEALFLLDEPDTHLNPAWSTQYLDFLGRFIAGRDESCHIVMTTHDPLVFSRLRRDQVRIISRGTNGEAVADEPLDDPVGMGIQAILASDLFRLPSGGLDAETLQALETQRHLSQRAGELTEDEREKLDEVTNDLEQLGFWNNRRDPIEQLFRTHFVPRWLARTDRTETLAPALTVDQMRRRDEIADEIAAEIAAELESASELASDETDGDS